MEARIATKFTTCSKQSIYLDYNATTPVLSEIWSEAQPYLEQEFGNPSSGHWAGKRPSEAIFHAREQVAALIGANTNQIVFTSGGTEANHLAIFGATQHLQPGRLLISSIEHPAVTAPALTLEGKGWTVETLPVSTFGEVNANSVEHLFESPVSALSVMLANNETGAIQPVRDLAHFAKRSAAIVHSDGAQAVGKIPVDVNKLGVDLFSIAGHKLYAPKGIGALFVRDPSILSPLFFGGGQESGLRPGTPNVPYIVALGAACSLANRTLLEESTRQKTLRDDLFKLLSSGVPGLIRHGQPEHTLPNTLSLRFPSCHGAEILARAPEIAASTGSACHDDQHRASKIILAMGVSEAEALGTVRLSIGRHTRAQHIHEASRALIKAWSDTKR